MAKARGEEEKRKIYGILTPEFLEKGQGGSLCLSSRPEIQSDGFSPRSLSVYVRITYTCVLASVASAAGNNSLCLSSACLELRDKRKKLKKKKKKCVKD